MFSLLSSKRGFIINLLLLSTVFYACENPQKSVSQQIPISHRVLWKGQPPVSYSLDSNSQTDTFFSIKVLGKHVFQFSGLDSITLTLLEFADEETPFLALQNQFENIEVAEGVINKQNQSIFYHSPYLCVVSYPMVSQIPTRFLKESLVFVEEDLNQLPKKFHSFPLAGRIKNSERIFIDEFLGQRWASPIYSVQYFLNGDTVTLFRMSPQSSLTSRHFTLHKDTRKFDLWNRELHFEGDDGFRKPVAIWASKVSAYGVFGCYDSLQTVDYAQKLKKMEVLWTNP